MGDKSRYRHCHCQCFEHSEVPFSFKTPSSRMERWGGFWEARGKKHGENRTVSKDSNWIVEKGGHFVLERYILTIYPLSWVSGMEQTCSRPDRIQLGEKFWNERYELLVLPRVKTLSHPHLNNGALGACISRIFTVATPFGCSAWVMGLQPCGMRKRVGARGSVPDHQPGSASKVVCQQNAC